MEKTDKRMKINRIFSFATVCLLITFLCLPFFQMSLRIFPDLKSQENRILAARPELKPVTLSGLWKYMQDYQNYFNDNFGFRNVLIRINSFVNLKILGVSPTPLPDIVAGKEGWLFYNVPNDGSSLEDYYGLAGFTSTATVSNKAEYDQDEKRSCLQEYPAHCCYRAKQTHCVRGVSSDQSGHDERRAIAG